MVQFSMGLVWKHQSDYKTFIKGNLEVYREVAEAEDVQKIDRIIAQE